MERIPRLRYSCVFRMMSYLVRNLAGPSKYIVHALLLRKDLTDEGEIPTTSSSDHLRFDWANEFDLSQIENHVATRRGAAYRRRLKMRHRCFCAKEKDLVVSFHWVSRRRIGVFYGECREKRLMKLPKRAAFLYNAFTYPAYRGQGYGTKLITCQHEVLKGVGTQFVYVMVTPDNTASLKNYLKQGYVPQDIIHCFWFAGMKLAFRGSFLERHHVHRWRTSASGFQ